MIVKFVLEKVLKMLNDSPLYFFVTFLYEYVIYIQFVIFLFRKLEEEIKHVEQEVTDSSEIYNKIKQEYSENKDTHSTKAREWRSAQSKIKRMEDDISMIKKELHRLERFTIHLLYNLYISKQVI